jgi:HSP20 family molecular chaperone IbpA
VPERDYLHQEIHPGQYQRQIALPGDCQFEQAQASVEDGVLTVRVPKARPRAPEKIRIQVNRRDPGS